MMGGKERKGKGGQTVSSSTIHNAKQMSVKRRDVEDSQRRAEMEEAIDTCQHSPLHNADNQRDNIFQQQDQHEEGGGLVTIREYSHQTRTSRNQYSPLPEHSLALESVPLDNMTSHGSSASPIPQEPNPSHLPSLSLITSMFAKNGITRSGPSDLQGIQPAYVNPNFIATSHQEAQNSVQQSEFFHQAIHMGGFDMGFDTNSLELRKEGDASLPKSQHSLYQQNSHAADNFHSRSFMDFHDHHHSYLDQTDYSYSAHIPHSPNFYGHRLMAVGTKESIELGSFHATSQQDIHATRAQEPLAFPHRKRAKKSLNVEATSSTQALLSTKSHTLKEPSESNSTISSRRKGKKGSASTSSLPTPYTHSATSMTAGHSAINEEESAACKAARTYTIKRVEQNRIAQRVFRKRRQEYLKELKEKADCADVISASWKKVQDELNSALARLQACEEELALLLHERDAWWVEKDQAVSHAKSLAQQLDKVKAENERLHELLNSGTDQKRPNGKRAKSKE